MGRTAGAADRSPAIEHPGLPAPGTSPALTYRDAGVDIAAASAVVERLKTHARSTFGAADAAPIGHFGGVFRLPAGPDRLLVASADGVGTKLRLAFVVGGAAHARVGGDLVNHCVNDILALGAQPLFFLDYLAMGALNPDVVEAVVGGMATACRENGLALIGGETAEMPGFYAPGEYDAAGFIVGEVDPASMVDGSAVREGDALIGLPSDGPHTNGYSLARRVLGLTGDRDGDRAILDAPLPGSADTVGEALLRPHRSYLDAVSPLVHDGLVRGMAHITGGGLLDNLPRMLPAGLAAELDPASWAEPPVFRHLVRLGGVGRRERYHVWNMGIGFVLAVAAADAAEVLGRVPGGMQIGAVRARVGTGDDPGAPVRGLTDGDDANE